MTAVPDEIRPDGGAARVVASGHAVAMVAGSMLGVGIFLQPRLVAELVSSPAAFLAAWALGGIIALCGALAYAELGRIFPRAGGDYVFVREAFGNGAAFAAGWVLLTGVFAGSIATMTVAACTYQLPVLIPEFSANAPTFVPGLRASQLAALVLIGGFTVVNVVGTKIGVRVQVLLTIVPVALLSLFAVVAMVVADPVAATARSPLTASEEFGAIIRAQLPIYFAYAGWNAVAYIGGELRDPRRTIVVGLLGGTAAIAALYMLLGAAFLAVLSLGGLRTTFEAGSATAEALGGSNAQVFAAFLIAVALLGTVNGTVLAGARVAWAMARDGVLPRAMSSIHTRWGTPALALIVQGAVSALLVLSGTYDLLMELTSIAMLLLGAITVVGLFVIKRREQVRDLSMIARLSQPAGAVYVGLAVAVVTAELVDVAEAIDGDSVSAATVLPVTGLVLFVLVWAAHAVLQIRRRSSR